MKKIILIIILLLMLELVYAQNIQVVKETKNSITQNNNLDVKIIFNNPYNNSADFEVKEILPQGITLINPSKADNFEHHDGLLTQVYRWQISLEKGEIASITYTIKLNSLGEYGITPTIVLDKLTNTKYLSNAVSFNVYCTSNNICEENENSLNCPLDCKKGLKDNICDYKLDNICDADCKEDPDCGLKNTKPIFIILIILILVIVLYLIPLWVRKSS